MIELLVDFKQIRDEQKRDLPEIAEKIKINIKYLEAIESGEYNLLPEAYRRMFISSYARELNVDPEEVFVHKFRDSNHQDKHDGTEEGEHKEDGFHIFLDYIERYKSQLLIVVITIIVIVSFFIVKSFWENIKGSPKQVNIVSATGFDQYGEEDDIIVNDESTSVKSEPVPLQKRAIVENIKFTTIVKDTCYLIYFTDNNSVQEILLTPNDSLVLEADNKIELKSGKVETMTTLLNNREAKEYKRGKKGTGFIQVLKDEQPKMVRKSDKILNYLKVRYGKKG